MKCLILVAGYATRLYPLTENFPKPLLEVLDDDMLVIAGDNLLDFSLTKFMQYAVEKKTSCVMRYYESETARLRKSGVVSIDENDKISQTQPLLSGQVRQ